MNDSIWDQERHGDGSLFDMNFPYAPMDWSRERAEKVAKAEGLTLTPDHWLVIAALQKFYAQVKGPIINIRNLHDALDERFHHSGGFKYLFEILPKGPISQGCRLAGLHPPAGSHDSGFGSAI